ncbi:MAG: serine/threonine protein kinase [Drouetiella hepatica Uher 2000/2452]|jgi:serine/threonine protein kinase|uniref:Serine/threonine protein kinase n=1 Tax=Drouetiella hepatica Uher 2000/2452 TaxID=904376 RepID=A0A951Q8U3_9CYAN|nr:serine/threonine protein kinase [Drouetiella hepatica Uher 2000/2452]
MIGQLLAERYLILEKLGSGGFSETYLARDKYLPCHPLCVVKCFQLSPSSTISQETAQQLFATEAQILDQFGQNHAQIPILFAYCHEQERIYQIQEYVEGDNLEDAIAPGQYLNSEAASIVLQKVLPILDYIHAQQVIHRDIKPSHLIYSKNTIVLIDFGAACYVSEPNAPSADIAIGTPGYMPDEQLLGMAEFGSDIYALGVSIIQMMTGVHPQDFQQNPISGELDWQVHLQGQSIDPHLAAILSRMVQRHPRQRYESAAEVLVNLRSRPVKQKPVGRSLKQSLSIRQLWKPTVAALLLLSGWYGSSRIEQAGAMLSQAEHFVSRSEKDITLVHDMKLPSNVDRMLIAPDNRFLVTAEADHALRLWALPTGAALQTLSGHRDIVTALDMSQDGRLLVSGGKDQTLRLWDTTLGTLLWSIEAHPGAVAAVAMSPDGKSIASSGEDGTLRVWDLQTGAPLRSLATDNPVTAMTYGGNSNRLVTAGSTRDLQLWDLQTGQLRRTFAGHKGAIVSLRMADDHMLFSFGEDRTLVWDLQQEGLMRAFPQNSAQLVTTLLGKQHAVTVHNDGNIRVWSPQGSLMTTLPSKCGQDVAVALGPNHRYLVGVNRENQLRIWQISSRAIP